ncbi:cell division protein FtsA [Campylobacter sp. Cr9]|uniref:cell division protein FtsA n=1 Tax=unclassified Campylobacter TaxID=2593542 RepID=UPI001EFAAA9D|nr:cell division protein FtsA [Campylobacter sp. RM5004]MBZ7985991.1 cell division protein FtsA [Campylobacter sp. Cr9]ULO01264.1 cell division protein FtsA [Campylobacter sp. RM5004]
MNILAIDLGSSLIKVAIVSFDGEGIKVVSVANTQTYGIKSGKITSINDASNAIKKAVSKVKENLSINIDKIAVSVSGAYTNSVTGYADIRLDANGSAITLKDIEKAINAAKTSADINIDQTPIHILPYRFRANNTDNIEDPLGMMASSFRLEANIITINKNDYENIKQILSNADIKNYVLVSSIYANAIYCLNNDEKENGVAIIDCGSQVCDIAIYAYNSIIWMYYFPFGSWHITSDIAKYLTASNEVADKIKLQFSLFKDEENTTHVEYYKTGSQALDRVSVESISKCVNMRLTEMLECIYASIDDSPYEKFFSRVVLTGGCFKIDNMSERASPKFNNKAVRTLIEKNKVFYGDNEIFTMPEYTCLLGLCMYASGFHTKYELNSAGVLLTRQKNNNFEKVMDFSTKIDIETKNEEVYYNNIDTKEQKLLEPETSEKDEVLESLKIVPSDEKTEGFFARIWKKVCIFIERIF